jgi:hypothetical protein
MRFGMHNTAADRLPKACQKKKHKNCENSRSLASSPKPPAMAGWKIENFLDKTARFCTKMSQEKTFPVSISGSFFSEAATYRVDLLV